MVVDKVQQMREDLGSVGEVIAKQVEERMLGRRSSLELPEDRRKRVHEEVRAQLMTEHRTHELQTAWQRTRQELDLEPENLALVLDSALRLHGMEGLQPIEAGELAGFAYRLTNLPTTWRDAREALLDPDGRRLALAFDHAKAAKRSDVALIHLNHPLMKHAIGTFRANLWSADYYRDQVLHRVSYRVLSQSDLNVPVIVAWGRLVATSALSQKLHEGLVMVGGQFQEGELYTYDQDMLRHLLSEPYQYPPIPRDIGDLLRRYFPAHKRQLLDMLLAVEADEMERLAQIAAARADEESAKLQELIRDRIKELRARVKDQKGRVPDSQLELFDRDEYLQYQDDLRWLERELADLQERLKTEPQLTRDRYQLRSIRVFPLGLLYLLPESLVSNGTK